MRSASFISASADRDHDLERVAVLHQRLRMKTLRNDLAVALDGDLLAAHGQLFEHRNHAERLLETMRCAVHSDLNHRENSTARISPRAGVVQWQNTSFPS